MIHIQQVPLRLAIQTLLLPGANLLEQFVNAARYGFDAVEVVIGPGFDLVTASTQIQRAMAASGLPVGALCTGRTHDPLVPDAQERRERLTVLRQLLQLADDVGAAGVVSVPVRPPHVYPDLSPWKDRHQLLWELAMNTFATWAADLPMGTARLFLEPLNRYEAYFLNRVQQAVELAQAIDHPRITAMGDLFHMNIEEADVGGALQSAGSALGHVHIADNNRLQPGKGCSDFSSPFAALQEMGYQGFVTIECFSPSGPRVEGDPETALPETARFLRAGWQAVQGRTNGQDTYGKGQAHTDVPA